ncbi:MAG: hypothetical protein KDC95_18785 [Planctomycetes bacterium]|nr:hypothetical protein [Planctomycetota bacterium]
MPFRIASCSRPVLAAVALFAAALDLPAQVWTQELPSGAPAARYGGAAAFNGQNTVVIYGGVKTGPTAITNEVYLWNGGAWAGLGNVGNLPPRWGHQMVYDVKRRKIVTFGGRSPTLTATANDTWEFDVGTQVWSQAMPTASPSARAFYSMAYDVRRGVTQIFGSQSTFNGAELWEYDGTTWTMATPTNSPTSRDQPGLCYDKARGVTVLFGGWNAASPGTMYDDTWEYDGTNWTQVQTTTKPTARYRTSMVYEELRGRIVMYGGFGNATALTDTWEYDGNDWLQVATAGPTKSTQGYAANDSWRGQNFYYGGSGPTGVSNEAWTFKAPTTAIFGPYGKGCATSAGLARVQGKSVPKLGTTFAYDIMGVPTATSAAILLQGFSSLTWGAIPLPVDLSGAGFQGCQLEVSVDFVDAIPVVGNTASASLLLPSTPSLLGLTYFVQALLFDPQSPNGVAGMSNAGRAVLGS